MSTLSEGNSTVTLARTFTHSFSLTDRLRLTARRGSAHAFLLLVVAGAATVVTGSYMTWATFYAGLISRNGVSGHGKYFIGLAAASVVATALSTRPGVSRAIRWLVLPAGALIAGVAFRDLHNLRMLVHDPGTGFYLPGEGKGLFVVVAGGVILSLAVFASPSMPRLHPLRLRSTVAALFAVGSVAMLVPAAYSEYYARTAGTHIHQHAAGFDTSLALTVLGALAAFVAARLAILDSRRAATGAREARRAIRTDPQASAGRS